MLSSLGMDAALVRYAGVPNASSTVFRTAFILASGAILILTVLVPLVLHFQRNLFGNTSLWITEHYWLVFMAVTVNTAWNLTQSALLGRREAKVYAMLQVTRVVFQLLLVFAILYFLRQNAGAALFALTTATLVVLLWKLRAAKFPEVTSNPFQAVAGSPHIVRYGFSMLIYGIVGLTMNYTQRLVLDHYENIATLGVFAYFNVLALQLNGLWGAVVKAWSPEFFALADLDRDRAVGMLRKMLVLISVFFPLFIGVGVVLGESFLARMVFPPAYAKQTVILWPLLLALIFNGYYAVASPLYYHTLRIKRILAITIFLAVANLALSIVCVRAWGAKGATISFFLLGVLTAASYLSAYREWVDVRRLILVVTVTAMTLGATVLLLIKESTSGFVILLLTTSMVAWLLEGNNVRLMSRRFLDSKH